jgi:hypothetical protein
MVFLVENGVLEIIKLMVASISAFLALLLHRLPFRGQGGFNRAADFRPSGALLG